MRVAGLLLAAGAGRRMGTPKALLRHADGTPYLRRAVEVLLEGGCQHVTVVLGAAADQARVLLAEPPHGIAVVVARDWDEGMGASLRAGLDALADGDADAAIVSLVDLPDVGPDVLSRVLATTSASAAGGGVRQALVRTTYDGRPGHPVLLGRDHWAGVRAAARGDHGARDYFAEHTPTRCECADLATGRDVDRPEDLTRG